MAQRIFLLRAKLKLSLLNISIEEKALILILNRQLLYKEPVDIPIEIADPVGFLGYSGLFEVKKFLFYSR